MRYAFTTLALVAELATAFPFVARQPGVDTSLLKRQQPGSAAACPFNPNHVPAPGIQAPYFYNNATNGLPGLGLGGYQVPAPGDTAHYFVAPGPNDIRGPCPGLNAAANHNFIAHDGIVTFNELVDAQQNLYNVGYDLAVNLAVAGLVLNDGDIATMRLSIGCDATTRTSVNPTLTGLEPGLDSHNKFESDSSLTRNDYFLGRGDNFSWNATLFGRMVDSTGGLFDQKGMAKYRYERYMQSKAENPNFYFGPLTVLLYGAASFLYELMPSGPDYVPDVATISSFFGAQPDGQGGWTSTGGERIPPNWTNRVKPYTGTDVVGEILAQYLANPVLFGGNTGDGTFDLISYGAIQNGTLATPTQNGVGCLMYMLLTQNVPSSLNAVSVPATSLLNQIAQKINPGFVNFGCPLVITT